MWESLQRGRRRRYLKAIPYSYCSRTFNLGAGRRVWAWKLRISRVFREGDSWSVWTLMAFTIALNWRCWWKVNVTPPSSAVCRLDGTDYLFPSAILGSGHLTQLWKFLETSMSLQFHPCQKRAPITLYMTREDPHTSTLVALTQCLPPHSL